MKALLAATAFIICLTNAQQIDVIRQFGFSLQGVQQATSEAQQIFLKTPTATVTLFFRGGTHRLHEGNSTLRGVFDFSSISPAAGGRLVLAGEGMDATVLGFDGTLPTLYARPVTRVTIRDIHFTRNSFTVSQGTVVSANTTHVMLDIDRAYPSPAAIFDSDSSSGRFLRRYTDSLVDPHIVVDPANNGTVWPPTMNVQWPWHRASQVGGEASPRWALQVSPIRGASEFSPGDRVGIKSKHQQNSFFFDGGQDVAFLRVRWSLHSRGVARGGIHGILVDSCVVERPPKPEGAEAEPMLATPGGGPQLGQPNDPVTRNVTVRNHTSVATGDDSVALFRVEEGLVEGCRIRDSFARGVLVCGPPNDVVVRDSVLVRNPVFNTSKC